MLRIEAARGQFCAWTLLGHFSGASLLGSASHAECFDRGLKWIYVTSLPVSQWYHVGVDMRTPYWVYGGLQDNGCWRGPSATYFSSGISDDARRVARAIGPRPTIARRRVRVAIFGTSGARGAVQDGFMAGMINGCAGLCQTRSSRRVTRCVTTAQTHEM